MFVILVVTEKNDASQKIAELLGASKPKADKVYSTPVYRFTRDGEDWVTIGMRGHILGPDFVPRIEYKKRGGWRGINAEGEKVEASIPEELPKPPFKKRKPFTADGVEFGGWRMEALPYLVYAPIEKLPTEKNIIRALKNLASKADSIIIATDFDREGELIGSDVVTCIKQVNTNAPISRARFSAFTKAEIDHAFTNLVDLDTCLAEAGESRREIDLIWGAVLTRYLTMANSAGFGNVRSSGRVQTPTLALVVEREKERLAFIPEDYWVIKGAFEASDTPFEAGHATARFKNEADADAVMANVEGQTHGVVSSIEKKQRKVPAPIPFNTTSLMAAASAEGLSPARTMRIAESLYMRGFISYPRVDNTVYPSSLDLREIVNTLSANPAYKPYCEKLLSQGKLSATRGKTETTDHPPIYPTAAATSDTLSGADFKLYNLIARRFLATLSGPATIEGTKVTLDVNGEPFNVQGDVLVVPGFRAIYPYGLKKDEQLPAMEQGQQVAFSGATKTAKQTEPPARYSQGKLIQEMEKQGLGTKSTRHSMIERLYDVKYVQNNPIEPTALGMAVIDALGKFAPHITSSGMTADLEAEMTSIADGKIAREEVVADSRYMLSRELENLIPHSEDIRGLLADASAADAYVGECPKCGKDLQMRHSRKTRAAFIGCSGWPECDVTYPVPKGKLLGVAEEPCDKCGMPKLKFQPFRQKPREQCINPECETNVEPDVEIGECPTCKAAGKSGVLIARKNPRTLKRFIRCSNYDDCNTGYPLPQYGTLTAAEEVCEHCGVPKVIVNSGRGPWNLCPNYDCPSKQEAQSGKKGAKKGSKKATKK